MKWVTAYASLFKTPGGPERICYLPAGSVVNPTGRIASQTYAGVEAEWIEVVFETILRVGWVYAPFLEDLVNEFKDDEVKIEFQTDDPNDAAQDMYYLGQVQYNLCGELCACYIAKHSIAELLTAWQPKAPSVFNRVFMNGRSRPTGTYEVQSMLSVYGLVGTPVADQLRDPVRKSVLVTPGRMARIVADNQVIVGVKIDGVTGNLRGSGIGHWICIESVIPDGINRGWVTFYNPFPNRMQTESWATVAASMGSEPYGLVIARQ